MFKFNDLIARLRIEIGDDSELYGDEDDYDEETEEDERNWWDHPLSEYEEETEEDDDYDEDDDDDYDYDDKQEINDENIDEIF